MDALKRQLYCIIKRNDIEKLKLNHLFFCVNIAVLYIREILSASGESETQRLDGQTFLGKHSRRHDRWLYFRFDHVSLRAAVVALVGVLANESKLGWIRLFLWIFGSRRRSGWFSTNSRSATCIRRSAGKFSIRLTSMLHYEIFDEVDARSQVEIICTQATI